jgi:hypothetical protein
MMTRYRPLAASLAFLAVPFAGPAFLARAANPSSAPDSSVPESAATAPGSIEPGDDIDPARQAWLAFAAQADPGSFAGGAAAGDLVEGNRVIAIGDSLMASTARRYGGELCESLVPGGWDVEVDAETGRFVDFGERVLDRRLDDGFDVGVVMLGNNYGADPGVFRDYLERIVEDLAPRPTVLYSVSLYKPNRADVNAVIYDIAMGYDNVRVIDWEGESARHPEFLSGDRLHMSDAGRVRFAALLAEELGEAPGAGGAGDCLSSSFTDDSATSGSGATLPGQAPTPPLATNPSNNGGGGGGGTTAPPAAPPTTAAPPPTTAAPTTAATPPPPTNPPATNPPATNPPATNPPATNPPATNPPATNPPATNPPPAEPPANG